MTHIYYLLDTVHSMPKTSLFFSRQTAAANPAIPNPLTISITTFHNGIVGNTPIGCNPDLKLKFMCDSRGFIRWVVDSFVTRLVTYVDHVLGDDFIFSHERE